MSERNYKTINLPGDDSDDFEIVFKWLYGDKKIMEESVLRIATTYKTAYKYCLPDLQHALVEAIKEISATTRLTPTDAMQIYRGSPNGCKLRNVVVDRLHDDICKWPDEYGVKVDRSDLTAGRCEHCKKKIRNWHGSCTGECKSNIILL
ncbi:hypothetical protein A1O7_04306 [Cladophialophora yegresii CBS 114405]|uniref:BTB domain-containing protein n=1 Tax=Cladophialophora yegresii CBS 114405 TaxID=1182544 RepID=W9WP05_9EURO|nr:uncharacterized protein A1O7_04306 [Cladophialophora yegresii CBS 114405]EXJ60154.1 hypothetical protein A1O7_04306 [Cladophialophora yegresii CBS 114405]